MGSVRVKEKFFIGKSDNALFVSYPLSFMVCCAAKACRFI